MKAPVKKSDCFYYIFSAAALVAAKLSLMAHDHKWECLTKRLDCCVLL